MFWLVPAACVVAAIGAAIGLIALDQALHNYPDRETAEAVWPALTWTKTRPRRWSCSRWPPGRTSSPPRALTGGTGGGGSPARSPKTG